MIMLSYDFNFEVINILHHNRNTTVSININTLMDNFETIICLETKIKLKTTNVAGTRTQY